MKNFLILILTLIPSMFYGQELKQYSGDFEDGTTQHGKATYSYYLKNEERIKQGTFSYSRNVKSNDGSFNSSITGSFKNNLKDGNWTQTVSFIDWDNGTGNFITGNISLSSNYNNGLPNGSWIYTENSKSRIKKHSSNGFYWSSYTEPTSSKANINFKNGVLNGSFLLENFLETDNYKTTFDDKGYCTKNLLYSGFPTFREETSIEYYKNVEIKEVKRNKSTGEIIKKINFSPDDIVLLQKYSDGQVNQQELRKNHLKVDTVKLIKLEDDFKSNIYKSFFLNEYIKGDKVFDGSFDFGGYYLSSTKFEIIPLSKIDDMERVVSYMSDTSNIPHLKFAMELLSNVKPKYEYNLTESDFAQIEQDLSICKRNIGTAGVSEKDKAKEWKLIQEFEPYGKDTVAIRNALNRAIDYQKKYKVPYKDQGVIDYQISICSQELKNRSTPAPPKKEEDKPVKNIYDNN